MIAILQPHIPHYREDFFAQLAEKVGCAIFCYNSEGEVKKQNFKEAVIFTKHINLRTIGNFSYYNPFVLLKGKSDTLVLMLDFKHISTWLLLLTKFIHKRKIILWGQGISIRRFLKDEKETFLLLKYFLSLADAAWFYTENELNMWKKRLPKLIAVSLNNTISGIDNILSIPVIDKTEKQALKEKYNIIEEIVFIFCARFTQNRRIDLLLQVMEKLDNKKFGFIIIGAGGDKPDFSKYKNVYDFGGVYDFEKKTDLFQIADIYFQPAWLGLSVVEAMAYGKPVFSFKRSGKILQCVEYYYVKENYTGKTFDEITSFLEYICNFNFSEIQTMSKNAKKYVTENLLMENMITQAISIL